MTTPIPPEPPQAPAPQHHDDYEAGVNRRYYHVTDSSRRDSIFTSGLHPHYDDNSAGGVWLFGNSRQAIKDMGDHADVWEVIPAGLIVEHGSDASIEWGPQDDVHVTFDHVPPSRLRLYRTSHPAEPSAAHEQDRSAAQRLTAGASAGNGPAVPAGNSSVEGNGGGRSAGRGTGLRASNAVWHPDGPAIGTVREAGGDTALVTFRDMREKGVPVAELAAVSPGDPVTVTVLHSRPRLGDTRRTVTVREGAYVGPVPLEPSLSHVRIGGDLWRVPTEYVSVPGPAGQAAAFAWSHRLAAPARAAGPGKEAGPQDPPDAWAAEVKAEGTQDNGNHAAAPASPPDAFPRPVRPAAPRRTATKRETHARPRPGEQVQQRTRGRRQ